MYVFGSANLSETLMNENLFDEYRIGISPVILGNGNPLFKKDLKSYVLNLSSADVLKNGGVILTYTPKSEN
jgi:dihydrofolate reductase